MNRKDEAVIPKIILMESGVSEKYFLCKTLKLLEAIVTYTFMYKNRDSELSWTALAKGNSKYDTRMRTKCSLKSETISPLSV
jgi:hypothetical protein